MRGTIWAGIGLLSLGLATDHCEAREFSDLWGEHGEQWSPASRLPDFSHAGYRDGEAPLPQIPVVLNVKDFGAVGDGRHDDTRAFIDAIGAGREGAILVPPGRYLITRIVEIKRSGVVLRGAGPEKSVLVCPVPLETIRPNMGATTSGRPTSNYSWSGGMVQIKGSWKKGKAAAVTGIVKRGDAVLPVSSTAGFAPGQRVEILATDDGDKSLLSHLYSGDPGNTAKITRPSRVALRARVTTVTDGKITLDRPLRIDLETKWRPKVYPCDSTVRECGIEFLGFEFPEQPYKGHFTELGHNAIALRGVSDCWVREVRIANSDSGLFVRGRFCTLTGVTLVSKRKTARDGTTGHHGISIGSDTLCTNFKIGTKFIHDITMTGYASGSVCSCGEAVDLSLDHHKKAPFENLFSDIDAGAGTRLWKCGGGAALGKHSGARETFWNIRADKPQQWPFAGFGPDSMNLIGLTTREKENCQPDGRWFEVIAPEDLRPANLHEAQLTRRMGWK